MPKIQRNQIGELASLKALSCGTISSAIHVSGAEPPSFHPLGTHDLLIR